MEANRRRKWTHLDVCGRIWAYLHISARIRGPADNERSAREARASESRPAWLLQQHHHQLLLLALLLLLLPRLFLLLMLPLLLLLLLLTFSSGARDSPGHHQ